MPSSRLYELLAESLAKPSQASQDFKAFSDAGNEAAGSFEKFGEARQDARKISDVLGGDDTYGGMRMRDIRKNSALATLMEGRRKSDKKQYVYGADGNLKELPVEGNADVHVISPTYTIGAEKLNHEKDQDVIKGIQDELKAIRDKRKQSSILGTPLNQDQDAKDAARETYLTAQLSKRGLPVQQPVQAPNAQPSPNPANQGGQPVNAPSSGVPAGYTAMTKRDGSKVAVKNDKVAEKRAQGYR